MCLIHRLFEMAEKKHKKYLTFFVGDVDFSPYLCGAFQRYSEKTSSYPLLSRAVGSTPLSFLRNLHSFLNVTTRYAPSPYHHHQA